VRETLTITNGRDFATKIVGVPKEIKDREYRVALTPAGVEMLVANGHQVLVETHAGEGSGFSDEEYLRAGARIVHHPKDVWSEAHLIIKVKEPLPSEYDYLRDGLLLFTYLHLAADETLTKTLLKKKVTAIGYETVELDNGSLPLLTPMSEVAGRMVVQIAAHYLEKMNGGRGKLLGGVAGVRPADVLTVGAGVVGKNAAQIALRMGAHVTLIDKDLDKLRYLSEVLPNGGLLTNGLLEEPLGYNVPHIAAHDQHLLEAILHPAQVFGNKGETRIVKDSFLNAGHNTKTYVLTDLTNLTKKTEVEHQIMVFLTIEKWLSRILWDAATGGPFLR